MIQTQPNINIKFNFELVTIDDIENWANEKQVSIIVPSNETNVYGCGTPIPERYTKILQQWIRDVLKEFDSFYPKGEIINNEVLNYTFKILDEYTLNETVYTWSLQGIGLVILRMVIKILDDERVAINNQFLVDITDKTYTSKEIDAFERDVIKYAYVCIRSIMFA